MRFKVVVAYNGNNYHGWQSQSKKGTVQETIENALLKITKIKTPIISSGRTDAKVHAFGQVFHFDSDIVMASTDNWVLAFNSNLPHDINVRSVTQVTDQFHARFSAIKKRYDYLIEMGPYNVLEYPFVYQHNKALDIEKMIECSQLFVGTHDFSAFNATPLTQIPNQIRTISRFDFEVKESKVRIIVEGTGFLHHMVLMLVQPIIEVGANRLSIDEVKGFLLSKDKRASRYKAQAQGLILQKVWYPDEN